MLVIKDDYDIIINLTLYLVSKTSSNTIKSMKQINSDRPVS